jgi:hypothetical protein
MTDTTDDRSNRSGREAFEGHDAPRPTALGSAVRNLTLALATLTTGLITGVFYAYAVSVNLGLAEQPDASYVSTMQAINERIENPLFFLSFFGAALFLLAALAPTTGGPGRSASGSSRWPVRSTWGEASCLRSS